MSFSSHKAKTTLGWYVGARDRTDRVRGGKTKAKSRPEGQVGKAECRIRAQGHVLHYQQGRHWSGAE